MQHGDVAWGVLAFLHDSHMRSMMRSTHITGRWPVGPAVRFVLACCAIFCASGRSMFAQQPTALDSAIRYAGTPVEGVGRISLAVRGRVSADSSIIALYADLVRGTLHTTRRWDTTTVLWWLAESARPEYVPIFLRYAPVDPHARDGQFQMAVYGLARHAAVGRAASRLRQLATMATPMQRQMVVAALLSVNDTLTRAILRELPRDRMPLFQQRRVGVVLATSPVPRYEGHMPCAPEERYPQAEDGPQRCVSR
jgi:hypothetical protein